MMDEKLKRFLTLKIIEKRERLESLKLSKIPMDDERFKVVEGMMYAFEEILYFICNKEDTKNAIK